MVIGTNPTLIFSLPEGVVNIQQVYFTVAQPHYNNHIIICEHDINDCSIEEDTISTQLSVEETSMLDPSLSYVEFQVTIVSDGKVYKSEIVKEDVIPSLSLYEVNV